MNSRGGKISESGIKLCDADGCAMPAQFQIGFIAPLKKNILMPGTLMTKANAFKMWLGYGVCGSCREKLRTVDQLLTEDQMRLQNAAQAKAGKPTVDYSRAYLVFAEVKDGKFTGDVTTTDGKKLPSNRAVVKA